MALPRRKWGDVHLIKVAVTGTTEAGQTDGDPAEQGGDLARAVVLDLTHRRA